MEVERIASAFLGANCYLISENGHSILIDPCEPERLAPFLRGDTVLDYVLLTHEHADHIFGVNWLHEQFSVPVICSAVCAEHLPDPRMNYSYYYEATKRIMSSALAQDDTSQMEPFSCRADKTFSEDSEWSWQGHSVFAKFTPGHSSGSVSYLLDGAVLFAGDTVFRDNETITRFKSGSGVDFREKTLPWLRRLPPDTQVYPGHFAPFRLAEWCVLKRRE